MLSRGDLAWLAVAAYALHVMEEQILRLAGGSAAVDPALDRIRQLPGHHHGLSHSRRRGGVPVGSLPVLALGFAAFLLINALYFHIWPMIRVGGLVGGIITAVFLFLPIGIVQYYLPGTTQRDYWLSVVIGVVLVAFPLALIHYRSSFAGGGSHGSQAPAKRRG